MKRTVGALASVTLHLALILALTSATARVGAPPGHLNASDVALLEEKHLRAMAPPGMTVPVKLRAVDGLAIPAPACLNASYRGIGVKRYWAGEVFEVGPGTPAERAGIRVGDTLLNDDEFVRDSVPVGTRMTARVLRDGIELVLPIVIGDICTED